MEKTHTGQDKEFTSQRAAEELGDEDRDQPATRRDQIRPIPAPRQHPVRNTSHR